MKISMRDISRATALRFGLDHKDIMGRGKSVRSISGPRQIAMVLCRLHAERTLPEIGRYFCGRDHTTVLYAWREIGPKSSSWDEWSKDRDAIMALARKLAKVRMRQELEWSRRLAAGETLMPLPEVPASVAAPPASAAQKEPTKPVAYSPKLFVPVSAVVRGQRRPRVLPSDLAPPRLEKMMGQRA